MLVGFGMSSVLASASDESSLGAVTVVYIFNDNMGAIARVGWFSAAITMLFVATAFFPYLSWAPAML
ncbi:hypothetical protein ACVWY0_004102 [Arthrobacter sp. UYNi723]